MSYFNPLLHNVLIFNTIIEKMQLEKTKIFYKIKD